MIALLLGLVSKARRVPPSVYLVGAVLSAFGVLHLAHAREIGKLQADKAALGRVIEIRDSTIANLHVSISQERLNVGTLTARLREQNAAILLMQATSRASEKASALAVVRALETGRTAAEARLQPSATLGYESLNAEAAKLWGTP